MFPHQLLATSHDLFTSILLRPVVNSLTKVCHVPWKVEAIFDTFLNYSVWLNNWAAGNLFWRYYCNCYEFVAGMNLWSFFKRRLVTNWDPWLMPRLKTIPSVPMRKELLVYLWCPKLLTALWAQRSEAIMITSNSMWSNKPTDHDSDLSSSDISHPIWHCQTLIHIWDFTWSYIPFDSRYTGLTKALKEKVSRACEQLMQNFGQEFSAEEQEKHSPRNRQPKCDILSVDGDSSFGR